MLNKYKIVKDVEHYIAETSKHVKRFPETLSKIYSSYKYLLTILKDSKVPVIRVNTTTINEHMDAVNKIAATTACKVAMPYEKFWLELKALDGITDLVLVESTRMPDDTFRWSIHGLSKTSDTGRYQMVFTRLEDCHHAGNGTLNIAFKHMVTTEYPGFREETQAQETAMQNYAVAVFALCVMLSTTNIRMVNEEEPGIMIAGKKGKRKKTMLPYITIAVDLTETQQKRLNTPKQYITFEEMERRKISQRRGCFRDYTNGNGLFGKLHGVWYWNPIIMGKESRDSVVKSKKEETV